MAATAYTLDDMTVELSEQDYVPKSREPKLGLMYEFVTADTKIVQHKDGHLVLKGKANALDSEGDTMFSKYINIALPVSIGEHAAPTYAAGMFIKNMRPFFPEHAAYDRVEKDEVTGEKFYCKGDEKFSGKDYTQRVTEANKEIGKYAKYFAQVWIENGDNVPADEIEGKRFFAKVKADKTGKYVNIDTMYATCPADETVCYDKKEAMG